MTKDEVLALVIELLSLLDTSQDQQRLDIMAKLWNELPHSSIIDLIYQDMRNLTPEQVVEEAYQREAEHARTSASN